MKLFLIYVGSFVVTTLAMALVLFGVSEESLPWRDALIIGSVFGSLAPLTLWRWPAEQRFRRQVWTALRLIAGAGRK